MVGNRNSVRKRAIEKKKMIITHISLSCVMAVHGGKSLQANGVRNENSYEHPCRPINSGWAFYKVKEITKI